MPTENWGGSKLVLVDQLWQVLPASVLFRAPMDTITRVSQTFSAALVLFDAIPTPWVSKHYSVGLILSIGALKRTLAGQTVYKNGSIPVSTHLSFHYTVSLRRKEKILDACTCQGHAPFLASSPPMIRGESSPFWPSEPVSWNRKY